jgi:hypothetical protein
MGAEDVSAGTFLGGFRAAVSGAGVGGRVCIELVVGVVSVAGVDDGVPFFVYEAIHRLIAGSETTTSVLGIAVTASAIVLMPALGWASSGSASDSAPARRPGRGFRT